MKKLNRHGIVAAKILADYNNNSSASSEYFTIEALEDGLQAKLSVNACEYSLDGNTWNSLSAATNTPAVNNGDKIYFRGNSTSSSGIGTFTISKKCNVSGNIMSLLYGDNFEDQTDLTGKSYAFYKLFYNCTNIIDASQLILPATTLSDHCYTCMFQLCTSLTQAPELPATTLDYFCYYSMLYGCTSLTQAPELPATALDGYCYGSMFYGCTKLTTTPSILPATTLSEGCYGSMFYGCTKLTISPELPATTLASKCYDSMFRGCTSLVQAPELPATTLDGYCYHSMFYGCTKLTISPELPATTLDDYCYHSMLYGTNLLPDCSNIDFTKHNNGGLQGLFAGTKVTDNDLYNILPINPNTGKYWLPATVLNINCYSSMFDGCTKLTMAPELPATTLDKYCYYSMFRGCTSLVQAPELPATTLASNCYDSMFYGCTKLTTIPSILPATTLDDYCYDSMFYGCTSLVQAPELPATTLSIYCYDSMFCGCTSLVQAPELPATTLSKDCYHFMFYNCTKLTTIPSILPATTLDDYCYDSMFYGCTSLTQAPELPATTLYRDCYNSMFYNCTKLNYIKALFTTTPGSSYTQSWTYGVPKTGTFVKNASATWDVTGINGIPSGWTVVNDGEVITFKMAKETNILEYQAEAGMTWEEWVNSEYNTTKSLGGFEVIIENNIVTYAYRDIDFIIKPGTSDEPVYSTDIIIPDIKYSYFGGFGGN